MEFLYIIIPAILVAIGNYLIFQKKLIWQEVLGQVAGILAIMAMVVFGCSAGKKHDTEILNGHVINKARHEVSCRHSYKCNCYNTTSCDSKGHCTTTEHCSTCYEHSYDVDWDVYATTGMTQDEFSVDTIDRQGLQEPPRWTAFKGGDPFMENISYDNYVKANADTIYKSHGNADQFKALIPAYPEGVSDYHTHLDRMIMVGASLPDLADWNRDLTTLNCSIGPVKQCNIIMVVTQGQPESYYYGLSEAWLGGKKNDIIVMVDLNPDGTIQWTNTISWAKNDIMRVKLRDDILAVGKMDRVAVMGILNNNISQHFIRKRMREFKYLDSAIILTNTEFWWMLVGALVLSIAISVFIDMNDFGNTSGYGRDRY